MNAPAIFPGCLCLVVAPHYLAGRTVVAETLHAPPCRVIDHIGIYNVHEPVWELSVPGEPRVDRRGHTWGAFPRELRPLLPPPGSGIDAELARFLANAGVPA